MKIGFLGTGRMGSAIAGRLLEAKHEVRVWNRTRSKLELLEKRGATIARSPREAADGADIVVSMLADDDALTHVMLEGDDAAINSLPSGGTHVAMGTISPRLAERLTHLHQARGQSYVSAPVVGRPEAAERGELVVLAAGPPRALAACAPIFDAAGKETHQLGEEPKQANVVKLAVNFVLVSMLETLGEAYALVNRYGIASERFLEIVNGSVFKSPVLGAYGDKIAREAFEPAGFALRLGEKDVRLVLEAGEAGAVAMPFASVLRDRFLEAIDLGMADVDWSAVAGAGRSTPARSAPMK
jgi:3-hydroxyisobutyrate dehydrogenase-like beta-hydroxyacid dehydrogenase